MTLQQALWMIPVVAFAAAGALTWLKAKAGAASVQVHRPQAETGRKTVTA